MLDLVSKLILLSDFILNFSSIEKFESLLISIFDLLCILILFSDLLSMSILGSLFKL